MLAEKGHQEAKVEFTPEDVPPNSVKLTFKIDEGPAIKIQKIKIEGNHVFSERQLKKRDEAGQGNQSDHDLHQ